VQLEPALDPLNTVDQLVETDLLLRDAGCQMAHMLKQGALRGLDRGKAALDLSNIIRDLIQPATHGTQMLKDEIFDVIHMHSVMQQSAIRICQK